MAEEMNTIPPPNTSPVETKAWHARSYDRGFHDGQVYAEREKQQLRDAVTDAGHVAGVLGAGLGAGLTALLAVAIRLIERLP